MAGEICTCSANVVCEEGENRVILMIKGIIRSAKELWHNFDNSSNKMWVAWGAGKYGYIFLREVRAFNLQHVYIYDSKKNCPMKEQISINEISENIDNISFIITAAQDKTINEIADEISALGGKTVYRYIPLDYEHVVKKLENIGFYNGSSYQKTLKNPEAKKVMEQKISDENPFLFARWGSVEGAVVFGDKVNMLTEEEINGARDNAGFYPLDKDSIHKFAQIYIHAAQNIDILCAGCWFTQLESCYEWYSPEAVLVSSALLYPFWERISWTNALKGKNVLVINPFAELIEKQYEKRKYLFLGSDILPQMNLKAYKAVQSIGGNTEFGSWFHALEKMETDISGIEFDIALIGCGAYGMPLGAFIKKKLGKKAIHMGGSLQILFGIKGKRWESAEYDYQHKLYNESWVRPTGDLIPPNCNLVERGCYW